LNEADRLSDIATESKGYWGYSAAFMEACRGELSVSTDNLADENFRYYVAELQGRPTGFYGLERLSSDEYELEASFVLPANIGHGVGRQLMEHALAEVAAEGGKHLIIQGDRNAERFYLSVGAQKAGRRESKSIPGRYLPLFTVLVERPKNDTL
jgi:GNAT superfamily N-acetyltransferase